MTLYNLTDDELNLYKRGNRQVARITLNTTDEDEILITEADIKSLSIERHSVSGERLELGSCVAGQMALTLDNRDGKFDDVTFGGAEMYVTIGTKDWNDPDSSFVFVPMGYFTVDESPRMLSTITLAAFDRMVLLDNVADISLLSFPRNVNNLIGDICRICNIPVGNINGRNMVQPTLPGIVGADENTTWRTIIQSLCEIAGVCGYINYEGAFCTALFPSSSGTYMQIKNSDRLSSDLAEEAITTSGISANVNDTEYLYGDDAYAFRIENNMFLNAITDAEDIDIILTSLLSACRVTYTPFTASTLPIPNLAPLDGVVFVDKNNDEHFSIITNYTFQLNGATAIESKGESATRAGYARMNALTRREASIINNIRRNMNETLNNRVQSVLAFNEMISNALGLWASEIAQEDGSVKRYMHDKENLEESMTIFTINAGGIAWTTDGWNGGSPIWQTGVTAAGDALFRKLSAEGISVSRSGEDYSIEITPSAFDIYYKSMLVTEILGDEMTIPKLRATVYIETGKIRIVPYNSNGALVGTNVVFID